MNIHEYQAKGILRDYNIKTPEGHHVESVEKAKEVLEDFDKDVIVVKSQIHSGGRGKAGGIKLAKSKEEALTYAEELLGKTLYTAQTGPEGRKVKSLLIEEGFNIEEEYYVGFTLDRNTSQVVMLISKEGGVDIEENPDSIQKYWISPMLGLRDYQCREAGFHIGISKENMNEFVHILKSLYSIYVEKDCSLLEINPLIKTDKDQLVALDAKMNFDSSALYRQKEILDLRDLDEEDPKEVEASKYDLSYIALDGNIGCMVNGAGLAMATMDIVKHYGGDAANFLDVGGSATEDRVREAFKIILKDDKVEGIFVNIFGGIIKCDVIASGIINALKDIETELPMVVRLQGTNSDLGKNLLKESGLNIVSVDTIDEGAEKIIELISK